MNRTLSVTAFLLSFIFMESAVAAATFCDIDLDNAEVESSRELEVAASGRMSLPDFNARIAEIPPKQESWVMDPVRVVLEYLGTPGARAVAISRCDASGEGATETAVRIIEDGYLDDSLRGTWYSFSLERDAAGRWLILGGREAFRCWRGDHADSYSERNCS
ncbi:MAG: hypothetical protein R3179_03575 [Sedimenticolaceae bacterium]|nr:hypothetical protein [Sedimenticolaceae bacterium]